MPNPGMGCGGALTAPKAPSLYVLVHPRNRTGGVCHARKNRHHRSFGAFCRWRRLFPPLASIHCRLGTTKLSALRGGAILEFIRSAFTVPGG